MTDLALPVSRVLLWRHGQTEWNTAGRFQGQQDPPLDEDGRTQVARAAPQLLAAGLTPEDTVVVSSDLTRAAETAGPVAALLGVPLRLDERLREHGMGVWEGLTRDEVADRFPGQYADWMAGRPVDGRGGEDLAHVGVRALAALADLPRAGTAVVVTHGGTAGRLLEALLGLGPEHRRAFGPLDNCAWSELVRQGTRWRLLRHNVSVLQLADSRTDGVPDAARTVRAVPPRPDGTAPGRSSGPVGDADAIL